MSEQEFPTLEDWWASGNEDYVELESIVRAITKEKDAEIERLKDKQLRSQYVEVKLQAKVAMMREALENAKSMLMLCATQHLGFDPNETTIKHGIVDETLSATEQDVTRWVNKVKADALEEAIKKLEKYRYENADEFFVETAIEILRGEQV